MKRSALVFKFVFSSYVNNTNDMLSFTKHVFQNSNNYNRPMGFIPILLSIFCPKVHCLVVNQMKQVLKQSKVLDDAIMSYRPSVIVHIIHDYSAYSGAPGPPHTHLQPISSRL